MLQRLSICYAGLRKPSFLMFELPLPDQSPRAFHKISTWSSGMGRIFANAARQSGSWAGGSTTLPCGVCWSVSMWRSVYCDAECSDMRGVRATPPTEGTRRLRLGHLELLERRRGALGRLEAEGGRVPFSRAQPTPSAAGGMPRTVAPSKAWGGGPARCASRSSDVCVCLAEGLPKSRRSRS